MIGEDGRPRRSQEPRLDLCPHTPLELVTVRAVFDGRYDLSPGALYAAARALQASGYFSRDHFIGPDEFEGLSVAHNFAGGQE